MSCTPCRDEKRTERRGVQNRAGRFNEVALHAAMKSGLKVPTPQNHHAMPNVALHAAMKSGLKGANGRFAMPIPSVALHAAMKSGLKVDSGHEFSPLVKRFQPLLKEIAISSEAKGP